MTDEALEPAIHAAIAALYERARVPRPTVERPIAPLGELVGSYSLTCKELPHLTSVSAATYLRARVPHLDIPAQLAHGRLAGFLYASARFGNIFVEQGDRLTRRRFSIAHELGHYVLHVRPYFAMGHHDTEHASVGVVEALPADGEEEDAGQLQGQMLLPGHGGHTGIGTEEAVAATPADERLEVEANRFAAELLMPREIVAGLVGRHAAQFRGIDLVWRLASDTLVSRAAMELRLHHLGLPGSTPPRLQPDEPGVN